ncbi:MAG: DNA-directed RNA polymerase subunit omega [Oligoflexia bacterium]|nr:DNA-directed RNA polymerase subunit omega [Oligoflexia bacterium]
MARVTVEDCLEQVPNRFALVHLAARRTKQILKGSKALVKANNKEIVLALREIAAGHVNFNENENISRDAESELKNITSMSSEARLQGMAGEVYTVDLASDDID